MRPTPSIQRTGQILRTTLALLIFLPPLRLAWLLIHNAVNIYTSDEWQDDITGLLVQSYHRHVTLAELISQHNESRYLIARIDFLFLGHLFHGDARACMALSYLFACFACLLVYALARATIGSETVRRVPLMGLTSTGITPSPGTPGEGWGEGLPTNPTPITLLALLVLTSLLISSPVQSEAWFSGITHTFFYPIVFAISAMLIARARLPLSLRFALAALLCLAAQYSYANGVLTFAMLLPILLLTTTTLRNALLTAFAWIALTLASIVIYMHGFGLAADHPDMLLALHRPMAGLHYFLAFLGSPLGSQPLPVATFLGAIALCLFAAACLYIFTAARTRQSLIRAAPWVMIGFYALGSDALCTAGRLGFGVEQALVSRYTVFSIYLTIATLFLGAICLQDVFARRPRLKFPAATAAAIFTIALLILAVRNFTHGATQMAQIRAQRLRTKAAVDWINIFTDEDSLQILWPDHAMIRRRARQLNRLGLYQPTLIVNPDITAIRATSLAASAPGYCDLFSTSPDGSITLAGSAILPDCRRPADAVILCGQTAFGQNIAFAMVPVRPSNHAWSRPLAPNQIPPGTISISAYAFDAERGLAFRLPMQTPTTLPSVSPAKLGGASGE